MANAGTSDLRRPVARASSATAPQAAARSTLGSGRQTTTKPSVSAPASRAVARRESPRRGARPRRSARWARPGGPMSNASRTVRLLPETASVCARSVSSKAWSSSGVIREVSPTTSPGSSARASPGRSSVASRRPARSRPAQRCGPLGPATVRGSGRPRTRSTAAIRSPPVSAGASRPATRSRVDGSSPSQAARPAGTLCPARSGGGPDLRPPAALSSGAGTSGSTINSTGVRVRARLPSASSTSRTSARASTAAGAA
ncbi:hypothetical protein SCANM63S_07390 [Streptomyces canarius]